MKPSDGVNDLVETILVHDMEERRLVKLSERLGVPPSQLPQKEKEWHDELEWIILDKWYHLSPGERMQVLDIYGSKKDEFY